MRLQTVRSRKGGCDCFMQHVRVKLLQTAHRLRQGEVCHSVKNKLGAFGWFADVKLVSSASLGQQWVGAALEVARTVTNN